MPVFSERSGFSREPNALSELVARLSAEGKQLVDLTVSNPTAAGLVVDPAKLAAALATTGASRYRPEPFGLESTRAVVSRELRRDGIDVPVDRIALTASTSEGYGFAFKLLCDAGDSVLVPAPSYPLLEHLARLEGVELVPYRLVYDGAWHVDLDSLRRARRNDTRAVIVVSPNNPTGSYVTRAELDAIARLGLPIVSDEVFARYALRSKSDRAKSALEAEGGLVIALGGLSKLCALPQMKLAWMLIGGPRSIAIEAVARLELVADAYLSVATPVQLALADLLEISRPVFELISERIRKNLEILDRALERAPIGRLDVEGGWYATLRLPNLVSEEAWVTGLASEGGVLVQPGWFFDFETEPFVVVSLLTPEATFADGVERIVRHVEHWTSVSLPPSTG